MEEAIPPERDPLLRCIEAIASPTRLALLRDLRSERRLGEVDVRVPEADGRLRRLARQTIKFHLDALAEAGIVSTRPAEAEGAHGPAYSLNHQRLYALSEDIRGLARIRPAVEPEAVTMPRPASEQPRREGPRLVLLKGLDEGATFSLRPEGGAGQWVVGRSRSCDVPLDFDPSISHRNALVLWEEGRHLLEDVPGSLNGTFHNLRRLAPGERVALSHGDVVGVGRSILVYWA